MQLIWLALFFYHLNLYRYLDSQDLPHDRVLDELTRVPCIYRFNHVLVVVIVGGGDDGYAAAAILAERPSENNRGTTRFFCRKNAAVLKQHVVYLLKNKN